MLRTCNYLLIVAALLASTTGLAWGSKAALISGSYKVVQKTHIGSQTRVRLQLRLTNHGQRELYIRRLTLWDFSHPAKGGTQPCSIILRGHTSANITSEFAIPRAEYELWQRGTRPRLVVELPTGDGRRTTQAVRLDRFPDERGN
jgi:hypothetical protein